MRKYITVLLSTCLITFTNANAQNSTPIPNLSEVGSHCMPHDIAPISNTYFTSNPQLSSSASFLRLNVLSSLN